MVYARVLVRYHRRNQPHASRNVVQALSVGYAQLKNPLIQRRTYSEFLPTVHDSTRNILKLYPVRNRFIVFFPRSDFRLSAVIRNSQVQTLSFELDTSRGEQVASFRESYGRVHRFAGVQRLLRWAEKPKSNRKKTDEIPRKNRPTKA